MIAFIDDHREAYGVEPICKVLPIGSSTYHVHAARRADPSTLPARARSDAALMVAIRRVFEENFSGYGVRKVWRQLGREGIAVARCTVARLMRGMTVSGCTTTSASAVPQAPNRRWRPAFVADKLADRRRFRILVDDGTRRGSATAADTLTVRAKSCARTLSGH